MAVVAVRQSVVWPDQFGDDSRGRFWCASLVGVRLVCWCAGLLVCWCASLLVCWCAGLLLLLVFGCWCNRLLLMVNSCWNGGAGLLKSSVDAGCLDICIYHLYFTPRSRRNIVQQCSNLNSDQLSVEVRCDMNYEFGILIGAEVEPGIWEECGGVSTLRLPPPPV